MRAFLGIGSNLGDRLANLQAAVNFLDLRAGKVVGISRVYETAPMYLEDQPPFLNAAVIVETGLGPIELLRVSKEIELEIGRIQRERNAPREIDIDLLAVLPQEEFETQELSLPHPMLLERRFVLEPLADLEPELQIGRTSIRQRLSEPSVASQSVELYGDAKLSIHRD